MLLLFFASAGAQAPTESTTGLAAFGVAVISSVVVK